MKTILSLEPSAASRRSALRHQKGRGFNPTPFPSSAMSLGSAIPWRVALQQSPPPLHRPESMVYPPAETVNHHLTGAGEFSAGILRNFQPVLTPASTLSAAARTIRRSWFQAGRVGIFAFSRTQSFRSMPLPRHPMLTDWWSASTGERLETGDALVCRKRAGGTAAGTYLGGHLKTGQ